MGVVHALRRGRGGGEVEGDDGWAAGVHRRFLCVCVCVCVCEREREREK